MARLNTRRSTVDPVHRDRTPNAHEKSSPSPTPPTASFSSDKENRSTSRTTSASKRALGDSTSAMNNTGKRRRLEEQGRTSSMQRRQTNTADGSDEDDNDTKFYDPNQNQEERRDVRMEMRKNNRELMDRTDEFLGEHGTGLVGLIKKQNKLMDKVKQTADATMDSRFLLNASEITLKKSRLLAYGDAALGVDIDEFVSKCITFMSHGRALGTDDEGVTSTHSRRNRSNRRGDDESDVEGDEGDAMNWHILGERACFPNNRRPTAPNFLLGPLSVEKRVRTTQRRATQRRDLLAVASRPQELREADLERNEASNLTNQCKQIRDILHEVLDRGIQAVEEEGSEDMEEDEARALFSRHGLSTNWQVPLIKFALNPDSFGQTVENFFYISFLVKDGFVKVEMDDDGFPTLRPQEPKTADQARAHGDKRHQAIFSLDYKSWQIFKSTMGIKKSLIPHRQEESAPVNGRGWYG